MIDLQAVLEHTTAQNDVPGAVAMLANRDGILKSAAAGLSDPASRTPMSTDHIFQIASLTKAVTSVAALQLVERGTLSLDAPIGDVLPELADPQVVEGFDTDGAAILRPAKIPLTLRHLLTHTSGFGYPFTSAVMVRAQGETVPGTLDSLRAPLVFEPGEAWLYGISTDWIGRAVEAASGQTLHDTMHQHIFTPLGMSETSFHTPADDSTRAPLLARTPAGLVPMPMEIGGGAAAEFQSGGGGLYSTAADYMRFMRMILCGGALDGARVLSSASIAEMTRGQLKAAMPGEFKSTMPHIARDFDLFPGMATQFGLGFQINPQTGPNGRSPGSLSWSGIANCYYWIDPAADLAGLVMMQFLPFADPQALDVLAAVERAVYNAV